MFDFGFGDEAGMVTVWQKFLLRNGYPIGSSGADGIFGTDSKLGTINFQSDSGLGETGHVDRLTWDEARQKDPSLKIPGSFSTALVDWYRILPDMRANTLWGSQTARRNHWKQMYEKMLEAFSEPKDREIAIARMRTYYATLERYSIGEEINNPQVGATTVHPVFKIRLGNAVNLAKQESGAEAFLNTISSQGGFNIRKITGGSSLSNHSFGTAIDLSAARNPFVYKGDASNKEADFPIGEFIFITNANPFDAEMTNLLSNSRYMSFSEVSPIIKKQCRASDNFVVAFSTFASLAASFVAAVSRKGWPAITDQEARVLMGETNTAVLTALENRIGTDPNWTSIKKIGRELGALFATKERAEDAEYKTEDPGYIAKWGWVNLDENLITALICQEGGGFRWIGAGSSRKDAMHFELHADDAKALRIPLTS